MNRLRFILAASRSAIAVALCSIFFFPSGIVAQQCEKKLVSPEIINRLDNESFKKKHGFDTVLLHRFFEQVLISINGIQPQNLWENQDFIVNYTVTNLTLEPANGKVTGRFDDHNLTPIGNDTVRLLPGESVDGQMKTTWGISPNGKELKLRYADKLVCHTVPSPHFPFDPNPVDICIAGVLAEDSANLNVRSVGEILTSFDLPSPQPPATGAICGNGLYARGLDAKDEWAEIPDGRDVPVVGRVINHKPPHSDLPWDHPFGFDYTFNVAPDLAFLQQNWLNKTTIADLIDCTPAGIAAGRGSGDICEAFEIERRHGLRASGALHTEIEDRLIPAAYRPQDGERVYMRGNRIVDCGHNDYSVEMHPPTIVARAQRNPESGKVSSTLFVMPYRTLQVYQPVDQNFVNQATAQFAFTALVAPAPLNLVARIKNVPFDRQIIGTYRISIPTIHGKTNAKLQYHFVVRPGVKVEVSPLNDYHVNVTVTLDPRTYVPLSPPNCSIKRFTFEDAEKLNEMPPGSITDTFKKIAGGVLVGLPFFPIPAPILINAMVSAKTGLAVADCTVPNSTPLAPESRLDNSVQEDRGQPYPVYGWVSLEWIN
jgi:hypothetical protein